MRKVFFLVFALFATMSANAQFVTYQPVDVPRQTYTPSPGYGTPFVIYEPVPVPGQRQAPKPKMRQQTLTGYYKYSNEWRSAPIRVGFTSDDKVILLSVKSSSGWHNCGNTASMVGAFDSEEVRDNFTYKCYSYTLGTVYF